MPTDTSGLFPLLLSTENESSVALSIVSPYANTAALKDVLRAVNSALKVIVRLPALAAAPKVGVGDRAIVPSINSGSPP